MGNMQPEFQADAKWGRHRTEPPRKDLLIETVVTALTPDWDLTRLPDYQTWTRARA